MINCMNCDHARKAGNSDKIACGFLSLWKHGLKYPPPNKTDVKCPHCGESIGKSNKFEDYFINLKFRNDDGVYEGWAYLGSKPNGEKCGMMSNFCVIVDKDNYCENFKVVKEMVNNELVIYFKEVKQEFVVGMKIGFHKEVEVIGNIYENPELL